MFQNVHRAAKRVKVLVWSHLEVVSCEQLQWVLSFLYWDAPAAFVCQPEGVGPEVGGDGGAGPAMFGVHNHGACAILQVSDAALRNAVLKVCVDPAKCKALSLLNAVVAEGVLGEPSVVAVIVLDGDVARPCEALESVFGSESFDCTGRFLKMNVCQSTEMIDEDGGASEALCGGFAFGVGNEAWSGALQLVHGDDIARCDGDFDLVVSGFGSPCAFACFAEEAC